MGLILRDEKVFYVYLHRRLDTGGVFYVGKGKCNRAFSKSSRSKDWHDVVSKFDYSVDIVKDAMSECCALTFERLDIQKYGIKNLVNKSVGGQGGGTGVVRSKETRKLMAVSKYGNKSRTGMSHSQETKDRIGLAHKGKHVGYKARENIGYAGCIKDVIHLVNDDGRKFTGIRRDAIKEYKLHKSAIGLVIRGLKPQYKGWRLA